MDTTSNSMRDDSNLDFREPSNNAPCNNLIDDEILLQQQLEKHAYNKASSNTSNNVKDASISNDLAESSNGML